MGRPPRITQPGLAYHLLNRRVMRLPRDDVQPGRLAIIASTIAATMRPGEELRRDGGLPARWQLPHCVPAILFHPFKPGSAPRARFATSHLGT